MKVLMISEYFYPYGKGGGEISAFLLAKEYLKEGIEIHILTSRFKNLKEEETIEGIKIHRNLKTGESTTSFLGNLERILFFERSLLNELKKLDKKENFEIIRCMNITSIVAVKLKSKLKKKFILHVNSPVLFCPKGTLIYKDKEACGLNCSRKTFIDCYLHSSLIGKFEPRIYEKYNPLAILAYRIRYEKYQKLLTYFDQYVAISKFLKKELIKKGISEKKISVVYPIIERERFENLKKPNNKIKRILFLGEYSKPKGPHILLEALKNIKSPYEANFYGEGILKEYLKKEVKKFNLNVNINDKADYRDIPKIMETHDILVVPSLVAEGFGRVALEGIIANKIVIASNVGGLSEIIKKNVKDLRYLRKEIEKKLIPKK